LNLADQGCIHGPVHTSLGREACAAGAMATLKQMDKLIKHGIFTKAQIDVIRSAAKNTVEKSLDRCTEIKGGRPALSLLWNRLPEA
jgi:TPP-dependent pyruvate/acetoin dehydrogenase alpha subunit